MAEEMRPRARPQGRLVEGDGAAHQGRGRRPGRCRRHDRGAHRRDRDRKAYEAALERAARYREAGADIAFVEAPPSEAELAEVPKRLGAPCLANMVEGGRTPVLPFPQLEAMGFKVAIYPNSLTRLFARAGQDLLGRSRRPAARPPWPTRCSTTASSGRCSRTSAGRRSRSASSEALARPDRGRRCR